MGKTLLSSGVPEIPTPPVAPPVPSGSGKTLLSTIRGKDGDPGDPGEDAYQIAVENGYEGSELEWLESLDGVDGTDAYGIALLEGFIGDRAQWVASLRGKSAYELAVLNGYNGTAEEWLDFLKGDDGKSAYLLAVDDGFEGDLDLWLDSLEGLDGEDGYTPFLSLSATHLQVTYVRDEDEQGPTNLIALSAITGPSGKSAYQSAVSLGFVGTEAEWIASLKGANAVFPQTQGSATTVAYGQPAELNTSIDPDTGLLLFKAKIPAGKDGTSPAQPVPSVIVRDAADGAPGSATVSGTYPNWNFEFFIRRGTQGVMGLQGPSSPETNTYIRYGNGSPVGVVSAPVGTTWTDFLQTNGVKRWFKASGTGTTGWVIDEGDTGWIQVGNIQNSANTNISTSYIEIRRINNEVYVSGFHQKTAVNGLNIFHLPTGFWPINGVNQTPRQVGLYARDQAGTAVFYMEWNWYQAFGAHRGFGGGTNTTLTRALLISGSYTTTQPWPDTLTWA